jgi:hypothetical protein
VLQNRVRSPIVWKQTLKRGLRRPIRWRERWCLRQPSLPRGTTYDGKTKAVDRHPRINVITPRGDPHRGRDLDRSKRLGLNSREHLIYRLSVRAPESAGSRSFRRTPPDLNSVQQRLVEQLSNRRGHVPFRRFKTVGCGTISPPKYRSSAAMRFRRSSEKSSWISWQRALHHHRVSSRPEVAHSRK